MSKEIGDIAVFDGARLGIDFNFDLRPNSAAVRWNHFFVELPSQLVRKQKRDSIEAEQSKVRSAKQVFKRALDELSIEATQTVLERIDQNNLYRGSEYKASLITFLQQQQKYAAVPEKNKDIYCWNNALNNSAAYIRNTAIGTLLIDLSVGENIDTAVRKFESVVAPQNYKRPKAIVTSRMVEDAEKTIVELGYATSLRRRIATYNDINVSNVLHLNRSRVQDNSLLSTLKEEVTINPSSLKNVEEVTLEKFINELLPTATEVKLLVENRHSNNLVCLSTTVNKDAPSIFKWNNNVAWTYSNNVTDSIIKERVKQAGGNVEGYLRVSLSWGTYSDLDLHILEPHYYEIYFGRKKSYLTSGELDVDMNAGSRMSLEPVENIVYPSKEKLYANPGTYKVKVNNFSDRSPTQSFTVEVEFEGETYTYTYKNRIAYSETISVVDINVSKEGIRLISHIKETKHVSSRRIWNLDTYKLHKVNVVCFSPNYWERDSLDNSSNRGNKHIFFLLDGCKTDNTNMRGVFNEYLKDELVRNHKRVFELLGDKFLVEQVEREQLAGLGFSTTKRDDFYVQVRRDNAQRMYRVVV